MDQKQYLEQFKKPLADARAHAREVFPEESCGFIVGGAYVPLQNTAADPSTHVDDDATCGCRLCSFSVDDAEYIKHAKKLQAVVHSHPYGPAFPSQADMRSQEASGVAWIILTLNEDQFGPLTVWGGECPIEPLIGREFIHGINDCYSLIRDVFALGRDKLAEQGIDWPHSPITLPIYPRNDAWWEGGDNFYEEEPQKIGFVEVKPSEVQPGDVFLGRIRSEKLNHGGVLLGGNLILHHLPQRLSRREPAGLWSRCAEKWIRFQGEVDA